MADQYLILAFSYQLSVLSYVQKGVSN